MDPFPCEPAIIPPPPPPPPPILHPLQNSSSGSGSGSSVRRLRSVFWERIPQERVEGKRSVWSESDELLIDLSCLDELFQQSQVKLLGVKGHCDRDKHASKSTSQDNSPQKVCILGERSSLKVGIFMHHVKR
ncbi:FH2 domain-containing protein 1 [Pangasianodon hypophthalmus]|uniref:FH2 domain-containing protein 1 n=1 Tax=Pangasianodon hypophthalmus TaxID=310915 RepID=UPI002307F133|nr:FH2 domain-containing protein 1 [Pangasianodon hypophthalmus]